MKEIDAYFIEKEEPLKSTLLALRNLILAFDNNISEAWKYRMPFYTYRGKMFCYLWVHKRFKQPYIGFVDGHLITHPKLIIEKRARMKILLLDSNKDIPVSTIKTILKIAIQQRQKVLKSKYPI